MGSQFQLTRRGRLLTLVIGAAILILFILAIISGGIQKWLWMQQLNYAVIFWKLLSVKWQTFCAAFVVALYLWINLHLAAKKGAVFREGQPAGSSDILSKSGIQVSAAGLKLALVTVMVGAAAALCALLVLNYFRPGVRAMVVGTGIYVALYLIAVRKRHIFDAVPAVTAVSLAPFDAQQHSQD